MMSTTVDIVASADTFLVSGSHDNAGIYQFIITRSNLYRALLRFDLSSIPSEFLCTGATLRLYRTGSHAIGTRNLYEISDANGDWIEGTKSWKTAGSGEPNWFAKKADGAEGITVAWAGSDGMDTAGTDYINTILASFTSSTAGGELGTIDEFVLNSSGKAVVQSWFGKPSNNGFILRALQTSSFSYCSRQHATAAYHPVLSVTYDEGASSYRHKPVSQLTGSIRQLGT